MDPDPAPQLAADVTVTIRCGAWDDFCAEPAALAETAARLALARAGGEAGVPSGHPLVLDITLADDPDLRRLNRAYRRRDAPTNVLAFPGADTAVPVPPGAPYLLGDVVLALATIRREASEQHKEPADHLRHLVVHGVLHLLGHDHQNLEDAAAMEAREIAILAEMGVPDPYRDTM